MFIICSIQQLNSKYRVVDIYKHTTIHYKSIIYIYIIMIFTECEVYKTIVEG